MAGQGGQKEEVVVRMKRSQHVETVRGTVRQHEIEIEHALGARTGVELGVRHQMRPATRQDLWGADAAAAWAKSSPLSLARPGYRRSNEGIDQL